MHCCAVMCLHLLLVPWWKASKENAELPTMILVKMILVKKSVIFWGWWEGQSLQGGQVESTKVTFQKPSSPCLNYLSSWTLPQGTRTLSLDLQSSMPTSVHLILDILCSWVRTHKDKNGKRNLWVSNSETELGYKQQVGKVLGST